MKIRRRQQRWESCNQTYPIVDLTYLLTTRAISSSLYLHIPKRSYFLTSATFTSTSSASHRSLGATSIPSLKLATLDWAVKSGDVKLQDFFYPIGSVAGSPEGCALAWTYFQEVRSFRLFYSLLVSGFVLCVDGYLSSSQDAYLSECRFVCVCFSVILYKCVCL